ncbi:MAG TPA: ATP-dependent helicase HrpB [Polyangiaceae bacterium]|nr:ATP-dependent helicase HrpB [Polyangiaceae bacterium]
MALPIEQHIPEILKELQGHQALVLEAPPGAGKTTRVPLALLEAGFLNRPSIVVSEPRRLAARLAAHFVAEQLGSEVGQLVGYQVRFENRTGPKTKICYVTAGVLLQQLLDPLSSQPKSGARPYDVVILDEFHERQLETDQILALLKGRLASDPALRLIVMSATLNGEAIASFLDCPRVRSEGKAFPLRIEHESVPDDRPLEKRVSSAVKQALSDQPDGRVLVFLPTVQDIVAAQSTLTPFAKGAEVELLPLHGELSLGEQARAVKPAARRAVVLATNVAESSITVQGVTAVVDSGLARIAVDSPWSGRRELCVAPISQASATQRAGRAGRTAPGSVYRLFSEHSFKTRRPYEVPEIQRSDLSDVWLRLLGAGIDKPEQMPWMDPPPPAAVRAAEDLLQALGATNAARQLTSIGKRMLRFAMHPRLARVIVAGEDLGVGEEAALAAALLAERDIVRRGAETAHFADDSDILARCDRFHQAEFERFSENSLRQLDLLRGPVQAVASAYKSLCQHLVRGTPDAPDLDPALRKALLAGFIDRVARRRSHTGAELILANGTNAKISSNSVVHHATLLIAHDIEQREQHGKSGGGVPWVSLATRIEPEWLLDDYAHLLSDEQQLIWNAEKECVESQSRVRCGSVVLEESRSRAQPSEATSAELARAANAQRARFLGSSNSLATFITRLMLLRTQRPDLTLPSLTLDDSLSLFEQACQGLSSFAELDELDWPALFNDRLSAEQRRALDRELPLSIALPSGRPLKVNYEPDKSPWVSSRLQDFFGMNQSPTLCGGKLPLTLHLLAPNQRAVQVTTDLAGFWQRHYPAVRRELMRRYPRHAWPEDPLTATPPVKPRR